MVRALLTTVMVNVRDTDTMVEFWSALLDVDVLLREGPFTWLAAQEGSGVKLGFQQVDGEPTGGRRRLHLDLGVDDVEAVTNLVVALGGEHLEEYTQRDYTWRVLADPEGNEFCIGPIGG